MPVAALPVGRHGLAPPAARGPAAAPRAGRPPPRRDLALPSTPAAAPLGQQRGRVLDERRERSHGTDHDGAVGLPPPLAGQLLGPRAQHTGIGEVRAAPRRAPGTRHLRCDASTRSNRAAGRATASGMPGNPAPLPMSATSAGTPSPSASSSIGKAGKAVGEMDVDRLAGIPDRGGRVRVLRQDGQELAAAAAPAAPPGRARPRRPRSGPRWRPQGRVSRFTPSDQLGRSGVITMRRKGSSPSLCVSTSGRSFR